MGGKALSFRENHTKGMNICICMYGCKISVQRLMTVEEAKIRDLSVCRFARNNAWSNINKQLFLIILIGYMNRSRRKK